MPAVPSSEGSGADSTEQFCVCHGSAQYQLVLWPVRGGCLEGSPFSSVPSFHPYYVTGRQEPRGWLSTTLMVCDWLRITKNKNKKIKTHSDTSDKEIYRKGPQGTRGGREEPGRGTISSHTEREQPWKALAATLLGGRHVTTLEVTQLLPLLLPLLPPLPPQLLPSASWLPSLIALR